MTDQGGNSVSNELMSAIRRETLTQVSKWFLWGGAMLVSFAVLGWWGLVRPWLIVELRGTPEGAVIAVDSREKCPDPWVEFTALSGRFILGQGEGKTVNDRGGNSNITLLQNQLPPHEHPIDAVLTEEAFGSRRGWTDNSGGWWPGRVWIRPSDQTDLGVQEPDRSLKATRKTSIQSGETGRPIDVMPPYYVLRFCTR